MSTTMPAASKIGRRGTDRERSGRLPWELCAPLTGVLRSTQTRLPHTPTRSAAYGRDRSDMRQGRRRTQATHKRTHKGPHDGATRDTATRQAAHRGMHGRPTRRHRHGGRPRPWGRLASHDDRPARPAGRRRRRAPRLHREGLPEGEPDPAGTELPGRRLRQLRPLAQRPAQPRERVQPRPARRHWIHLHPPRRPGHRALRRRLASPRTPPTSTR